MKYISYISILIFIVVSIQCSKEDQYSNYKKVSIKEYKTNQPLSEAHLSIYICEKPDFVFGCLRIGLFSSCTTDSNGICRIKYPDSHFEHQDVEKLNYWTRLIPIGNDEYAIQPKAWVNIKFLTNVDYPATSYFFFTITGEAGFDEAKDISAVNNSHFILTLFGNEQNNVDWILYGPSNSTGDDVLNSGRFSLMPSKFENLDYTLTF